eukprot:gene21052-39715_t
MGKLDWRHATLVVANVSGYLDLARNSPEAQVRKFHAELLTLLMVRVSQHKGLTDGISGDRYYASVNGAKQITGHRCAGMQMAWEAASAVDVAG